MNSIEAMSPIFLPIYRQDTTITHKATHQVVTDGQITRVVDEYITYSKTGQIVKSVTSHTIDIMI